MDDHPRQNRIINRKDFDIPRFIGQFKPQLIDRANAYTEMYKLTDNVTTLLRAV